MGLRLSPLRQTAGEPLALIDGEARRTLKQELEDAFDGCVRFTAWSRIAGSEVSLARLYVLQRSRDRGRMRLAP
jgi:hypothetical protein